MMLKSVVALSILVALAAAFPATSEADPDPDVKVSLCEGKDASCDEAEEMEIARAALYSTEGDIIYPEGKNAITEERKKWPNGVVPYKFHSSVGSLLRSTILNAQASIQRKTNGCITFVERKAQANYVIYNGNSNVCSSYIGMKGGSQTINLGIGCGTHGTVVHEILHALGFEHEHNRSDRDQYLSLNLNNVQPNAQHNFNKVRNFRNYNAFDYKSIMIYDEYAFAINPKIKTMWDKTGKHTLGTPPGKDDMNSSDLYRLKQLYKCK